MLFRLQGHLLANDKLPSAEYTLMSQYLKHYSGQVHGRPEYNLYYGQPITADLAA